MSSRRSDEKTESVAATLQPTPDCSRAAWIILAAASGRRICRDGIGVLNTSPAAFRSLCWLSRLTRQKSTP